MVAYPDPSFLVSLYAPDVHSTRASAWMRTAALPLPFTPLHRHELRNAIRLAVFRKEITREQQAAAFHEMEADLGGGFLAHRPLAWTDALREAERLGAAHTETLGVRGMDLLHVAVALTLGAKQFLSFDVRQCRLAAAEGLHVKP